MYFLDGNIPDHFTLGEVDVIALRKRPSQKFLLKKFKFGTVEKYNENIDIIGKL